MGATWATSGAIRDGVSSSGLGIRTASPTRSLSSILRRQAEGAVDGRTKLLGQGTRTQFEEAKQQGSKYWLYVVENAMDSQDTTRIARIQNPGGLANRFFFDDNWRAVAQNGPE